MRKSVRRNYRFDYVTEYNLKRLVEMTGKSETQIVQDAIEAYMKSRLRVQELLSETRARIGL